MWVSVVWGARMTMESVTSSSCFVVLAPSACHGWCCTLFQTWEIQIQAHTDIKSLTGHRALSLQMLKLCFTFFVSSCIRLYLSLLGFRWLCLQTLTYITLFSLVTWKYECLCYLRTSLRNPQTPPCFCRSCTLGLSFTLGSGTSCPDFQLTDVTWWCCCCCCWAAAVQSVQNHRVHGYILCLYTWEENSKYKFLYFTWIWTNSVLVTPIQVCNNFRFRLNSD